jgi:DNA-binding MarR family transcriptional regulator
MSLSCTDETGRFVRRPADPSMGTAQGAAILPLFRDDRSDKRRLARSIQSARRIRNSLWNVELFADPAWDLLLDLYVRHLESRRTGISAACDAANVPMTTALRWIGKLEQEGLAIRLQDWRDGRRTLVSLTDDGVQRMDRYFEALQERRVA